MRGRRRGRRAGMRPDGGLESTSSPRDPGEEALPARAREMFSFGVAFRIVMSISESVGFAGVPGTKAFRNRGVDPGLLCYGMDESRNRDVSHLARGSWQVTLLRRPFSMCVPERDLPPAPWPAYLVAPSRSMEATTASNVAGWFDVPGGSPEAGRAAQEFGPRGEFPFPTISQSEERTMPIYMNYNSIPGDATAEGHEKWIELNSCQSGRGTGHLQPHRRVGRPRVYRALGERGRGHQGHRRLFHQDAQ